MNNLPSRDSSERSDLTLRKTQLFEMDSNLAAALSYIPLCGANVIFSIIWLCTEPKENGYLRQHAMQSLLITAGFAAVSIALLLTTFIISLVPFIGPVIATLLQLVSFVVYGAFFIGSFYLMYCAYKGRDLELPMITDAAKRYGR